MNDAQLKNLVRKGEPCRIALGDGLYFRITAQGTPFWIFRYTFNGKRRQMSIAQYGKPPFGMSLKTAKESIYKLKNLVKEGLDPITERSRSKAAKLQTVDDIAEDWLNQISNHLENPQIPRRVYRKDISPKIGMLSIESVNSRDILTLLREINDSGRPTIANDALTYLKQLFNHAIKLDYIKNNPASAFNTKDAGGVEKPRKRALSIDELKIVFEVLHLHPDIFTRDNLLALALLLVLGVRKGELIALPWNEIDFKKKIWRLPEERAKNSLKIDIPLPMPCIHWLSELYIRAAGSEYVFPARRASRRRGYISDDTLNHALAKIFGKKVDSDKKPYPNLLGREGIDYFVIHDLRRTARTLLAKSGVPNHVAERCLNHKLKGVEGVYNQYDYFEERKEALNILAEHIAPLVGEPSTEIQRITASLTL
ncbi:tyrosine-type recombinase/integrase [Vibrio cholerae]|uniref:tyrosine-type recombinase/integrase n=1 Tax=Vibrio cholerae TaxID=666 RepID=UPI00089368CF|nr:site-specific integrase [Vibrio cholerae]OFJ35992.1 integrase [Vibrio cholerae]